MNLRYKDVFDVYTMGEGVFKNLVVACSVAGLSFDFPTSLIGEDSGVDSIILEQNLKYKDYYLNDFYINMIKKSFYDVNQDATLNDFYKFIFKADPNYTYNDRSDYVQPVSILDRATTPIVISALQRNKFKYEKKYIAFYESTLDLDFDYYAETDQNRQEDLTIHTGQNTNLTTESNDKQNIYSFNNTDSSRPVADSEGSQETVTGDALNNYTEQIHTRPYDTNKFKEAVKKRLKGADEIIMNKIKLFNYNLLDEMLSDLAKYFFRRDL